MRFVSFDEETHLIKPGLMIPRMVCMTFAERTDDGPAAAALAEMGAATAGPGSELAALNDVSTSTGQNRGWFATGLLTRANSVGWLRPLLEDPETTIIGHNVCFDLAVAAEEHPELLVPIFRKFRDGLVHDTMIRQQLIDVATGEMKFHTDEDGEPMKTSYDLAALSLRLLGKRVAKKDTWRLKYALLDGVPLHEWPEEAKTYAIGDAVTTSQIHTKQDEIAGGPIPNSAEQHRAAWGLYLMTCWGIRTDGEAVVKLREELAADYAVKMAELRNRPAETLPTVEGGPLPWTALFNVTPARALKSGPRKGMHVPEKVSKNTKAIRARVVDAYQRKGVPFDDIPRTPNKANPRISTDRKTLTESGDELLKKLADVGAVAKLLDTYVPILESGTRWPINPRYNVLVETGRTSCSRPNIQNPPRGGGVRACFVPRDGFVYAFSDYDTLELRSLAQVCLYKKEELGIERSEMAEALIRGEELHLALAAEMLGITLEEAIKRKAEGDAEILEYRQQAKPANFGFPGGMAAESFREYAEGYNIKLTSEQAKTIHETWFRKWPEMHAYFDWVKRLTAFDAPIEQVKSGRIRGGASFCAVANGFFQGLAADGAKEAVWNVAWECYVEKSSPLYGCRPVFFIHDEIGIEIPYTAFGAKRSAAAAQRLSDVMIESMKRWIPDIPITCKPVMCRRWYKGAEQAFSDGVLVPSKPSVTKLPNGKKKTDWIPDIN